ncbi:hypothetical protein [Vitiosangium sp. GDMCC 1.1324]|uniref:hypothetical protein n=1 Tax=Vitiosangium sp. (strain GDMCC 1.1324) TaxID=2138576 RepID=UPI00130E331B|nr:hypothetical protein [Vitiosangium sp. GDMCC 1.1324]
MPANAFNSSSLHLLRAAVLCCVMGPAAVAYAAPCADGTTDQTFAGGMVGCAGTATWDNRASLCGAGYHPASANEWRSLFGGIAPAHNYWTNDDLRYSGAGSASCSAEYTAGYSCGANQPMRVCTTSGNDAEGNHCNWVNCGIGATTPNAYFGGCAGNTTAGTLCVPNGCADGSAEQAFNRGMVGCAGHVTWDNRATLCAPGYRLASADEWVNLHGAAAPSHNYWTNDDLKYNGSSLACTADLSGYSCGTNQPMRVCTSGGTDAEGNACNWANCGYGYTTPNHYFGGCVGNTTAGALCVPIEGCADGSVEQVLNNSTVGCAGSVAWVDRDSLCAPGWVAAGSEDWTGAYGSTTPSHNYWTNEDLKYNGSGSSSCYVSSTVGSQCFAGQPMRVCTPAGTDLEGNACNWTHCGLNAATPDQYFGGCNLNTTAGTLCLRPPP